MKKILTFGLASLIAIGLIWTAINWSDIRADLWLLRTDWAISRTKSWRMRLQSTNPNLPKEWMMIEALPPDREHGWQHVDRSVEAGDSKTIRIVGDLEYIRIRDDRYFRGDAMFNHNAAPQWIKLGPRDTPPLDGFFEYRFHMSNPRTIGYSFDTVETSFWSNYHGITMHSQGLKRYSGRACRESAYTWEIEETGRLMHDTVCIGTSDHLPYHLTTSGGWAEATYEWNPEVSIDAPNPVVPRPTGFISSLPDF